jgi:hypothetical protein
MFSYRWSDLIVLVSKQVKNIPTQQLDAIHCDLVSTRIAARLPWKPSKTTIAAGQIPLINGQQDYDPPFNIFRLTDASLQLTSTIPNRNFSITVRDSLAVDLLPLSPTAITSCALQAAEGKLRLSSAAMVPTGVTWELRGEYQINPTKVTDTSQNLWFDDRYLPVAVEGLTYWYYKLADDPRAGGTTGNWPGDVSYSGQLAQFMSAIKEMADAEDIGGDMQTMPGDPIGTSSRAWGDVGSMFSTGGNGSGGTTTTGIVSINNDTTPSQTLTGGTGLSVTNTGAGGHLISMTNPPGVASINGDNTPAQNFVAGTGITITNTGSGGHTITASGAGVASINGDSTAAQTFTAGTGITISNTGTGGHTITSTVTAGLASINGDATAAQVLTAGAGITITNTGSGGHTIAATGVTVPNFADNETVGGSGTTWTLAHTPNPAANLQLYQYLSGFGNVLLKAGTDYTLSGAAVTTTNSLAAGVLTAWYRF